MIVPHIPARVGEQLPIRFSFLKELASFFGQSLTGASVTWVSLNTALATFNTGSQGLSTSDQGAADNISNDACIGRFTMVAAGSVIVQVTVDATNPTATYVGWVQFDIEAAPTP